MPDKLSFPGLLPAGFHNKTLEEVKTLCVENFPNSATRSTIFDSFVENFIIPLTNTGLMCDVWVDGSFITEKENPEDIDVLVEFDPNKPYSAEKVSCINNFLYMCVSNHDDLKCRCHCDVYARPTTDIDGMAYWRGLFCFNRDKTLKGLAVIQINGGK